MAVKKDNVPAVEETVPVAEEATPAVEIVYDPWADMKTIRLPKAPKGEAQSQYVGINGRTFQVPLGKEVEVPAPVYALLQDMLHAMDEEDEFRDSIPNN